MSGNFPIFFYHSQQVANGSSDWYMHCHVHIYHKGQGSRRTLDLSGVLE